MNNVLTHEAKTVPSFFIIKSSALSGIAFQREKNVNKDWKPPLPPRDSCTARSACGAPAVELVLVPGSSAWFWEPILHTEFALPYLDAGEELGSTSTWCAMLRGLLQEACPFLETEEEWVGSEDRRDMGGGNRRKGGRVNCGHDVKIKEKHFLKKIRI